MGESMRLMRKEYMEQLQSWRDKQIIKVITGVRRCGKGRSRRPGGLSILALSLLFVFIGR